MSIKRKLPSRRRQAEPVTSLEDKTDVLGESSIEQKNTVSGILSSPVEDKGISVDVIENAINDEEISQSQRNPDNASENADSNYTVNTVDLGTTDSGIGSLKSANNSPKVTDSNINVKSVDDAIASKSSLKSLHSTSKTSLSSSSEDSDSLFDDESQRKSKSFNATTSNTYLPESKTNVIPV